MLNKLTRYWLAGVSGFCAGIALVGVTGIVIHNLRAAAIVIVLSITAYSGFCQARK